MYGELRIALNNVASQFWQLALQLARDVTEAKPNIAYSQAAGNWMQLR